MANFYDYIKWLGDFDFLQYKFNECDVLVLCQISYLDMSDSFKYSNFTTLAKYREDIEKFKLKTATQNKKYEYLIELAANSNRFGNIIITDYVDIVSRESSLQFSAMTFLLDADTAFIAFRGTDDTIIGWKEDFMMSFTKTKAQKLSLEYVKKAAAKYKNIIIAGHSKGGNLALYSGAMSENNVLEKVIRIWSLDGPGLCPEIVPKEKMEKIKNITTCIVPEYSIIGKLFDPAIPDTKIAESETIGLLQHDITTWKIDYGKIKCTSKNNSVSLWLDDALNNWISDMSMDKRKKFVDELFEALLKNGNKTLSDIASNGAAGFENTLINIIGISKSSKKEAFFLPLHMLFGNMAKSLKGKNHVKKLTSNPVVRCLAAIIFGIAMVIFSESILKVVIMLLFTLIAAAQTYVTIKNLRQSSDTEQERMRVNICIVLISAVVVLLLKDSAMFVVGSIFAGIFLLLLSYSRFSKFKKAKDTFNKVLLVVECIFSAVFGVSYLIIPQSTVFAYAKSIGFFLIADGVVRIVYLTYKFIKRKKA